MVRDEVRGVGLHSLWAEVGFLWVTWGDHFKWKNHKLLPLKASLAAILRMTVAVGRSRLLRWGNSDNYFSSHSGKRMADCTRVVVGVGHAQVLGKF